MFGNIEKLMEEEEFFIRKAIGWALRDYSKTEPTKVIEFVQKHGSKLSHLSKVEAMKYMLKNKNSKKFKNEKIPDFRKNAKSKNTDLDSKMHKSTPEEQFEAIIDGKLS